MGGVFRLRLWISALLIPLNGCLVNTHRLQRIEVPSHVIAASADQLIGYVNSRCEAIQSLYANIDLQVIDGGPKKGKQTTSTSFSGIILERKPAALRVVVRVPMIGTTAVDLATKGETFTLSVPVRNEAFEGANTVTAESQNPLYNLRPSVFSDSLLLGCISPVDMVTLTSDTTTLLDSKAKHLIARPDYDLVVLRRKSSKEVGKAAIATFPTFGVVVRLVELPTTQTEMPLL